MNEKTKKIVKIIIFTLASTFFLYNGFSMLIDESNAQVKSVETTK